MNINNVKQNFPVRFMNKTEGLCEQQYLMCAEFMTTKPVPALEVKSFYKTSFKKYSYPIQILVLKSAEFIKSRMTF